MISTPVRRFTVLALLVCVVAIACGVRPEADTSVAAPTTVIGNSTATSVPTQTPQPTPSPVPPPRASTVTLADGRTASILRNGPRDFIPAIFDPVHIAADEVGDQVGRFSPVIGVSIDGESVAYSVAHLSSHEVVNDAIGGTPIAVTW
jgi:hypothetical protein